MVEKNGLCPSCRKESILEDTNLSWEDIQGLSWLFCENCIKPTNCQDLKSIIA